MPADSARNLSNVCDATSQLIVALDQKGQDRELSESERNDLGYASSALSTFVFDAEPAAKGAADQLAALTNDLLTWLHGQPLDVDDIRAQDASLQSECSTSGFPTPQLDWQAVSSLVFTN